MNLLKKIMLAASMMLALNVADAAIDLDKGDLGNVTNGSITTSQTITDILGSGTGFSHYWSFNFDPAQQVFGFLVDSKSQTAGGEITVAIDPLTVALYKTVSAIDDTIIGSAVYDWSLSAGTTEFFSGVIDAGTYRLDFDGTVTGSQYGNYSFAGDFTSVATPVPEPSTVALMLAGLGLVGFMARRRKAA